MTEELTNVNMEIHHFVSIGVVFIAGLPSGKQRLSLLKGGQISGKNVLLVVNAGAIKATLVAVDAVRCA
jgi:hypothetical protein